MSKKPGKMDLAKFREVHQEQREQAKKGPEATPWSPAPSSGSSRTSSKKPELGNIPYTARLGG
jgi:hypothetical protein